MCFSCQWDMTYLKPFLFYCSWRLENSRDWVFFSPLRSWCYIVNCLSNLEAQPVAEENKTKEKTRHQRIRWFCSTELEVLVIDPDESLEGLPIWKSYAVTCHYLCKGLLRGRSYKVQMTSLDLDVHYRCYAGRISLFGFIPTSES